MQVEYTTICHLRCQNEQSKFITLSDNNKYIKISCDECSKKLLCCACSDEVNNVQDLKTLIVYQNNNTKGHYSICNNCWFDGLNDITKDHPISYAAQKNRPGLVAILSLDYRLDLNECDGDPIFFMCKYGHEEAVTCLLNDPRTHPEDTCYHSYALLQAYVNNHLKIVKMLLRNGRCNPAVLGDYLCEVLIKLGDPILASKIADDKRVTVNKSDWDKEVLTPLLSKIQF